jgi:hypothetical protein
MPRPVPASVSVSADVAIIRDRWLAAWPASLALWSRFTRLSEPRLCLSLEAAEREGLTGSFAMIRLDDKAVVVNLALGGEYGLDDQPLAILGHEMALSLFACSRWLVPVNHPGAGTLTMPSRRRSACAHRRLASAPA